MADARELSIITPELPQMEKLVLQRRPGIRIDQGRFAIVEWVVRDDKGRPADLRAYIQDSDNSASEAVSLDGSSLVPNGRVEARLREPFTGGTGGLITVAGTSYDPANGIIRFELPAEATATNRVLMVNVGIYDSANRLVTVSDGYLIVDRSLFSAEYSRVGIPTVDEIKIRLRDSGVNDNFLLARIEYSLGEVAESAIQAIATWNTVGGPNAQQFTTANFDDPDMLLDGMVGYLYEVTAHNYRRNHLQYQAAGVTVDDKANYAEYDQLAKAYQDKYRLNVTNTIRRAIRSAWTGTVHSPFLRRRYNN